MAKTYLHGGLERPYTRLASYAKYQGYFRQKRGKFLENGIFISGAFAIGEVLFPLESTILELW